MISTNIVSHTWCHLLGIQLAALALINPTPSEEDVPLFENIGEDGEGVLLAYDSIPTLPGVSRMENENVSSGQTREFWFLWITWFLNIMAMSYMILIWKVFGQTFIHDDKFLAIGI